MAKTKREFIIATFIISCCATIFSIVSMATEQWITADLKSNILGVENAEINYGLFSGTFVQPSINKKKESVVTIICLFSENVCGYSTATDDSKRKTEIENILNDKSCTTQGRSMKRIEYVSKEATDIENIFDEDLFDIELLDDNNNKTDKLRYIKIIKNILENTENRDGSAETTTIDDNIDFNIECDKTFINSGLWLTTTLFLSLSIFMGVVTSTLSVVNTAGNPVSPWFNIWGLYIWNGIASITALITMILYGALYGTILMNNVGIIDTLNGFYRNNDASLGFSYWMLFAPLFLHVINIGVFYYRQYLIEREPQITEDNIEAADKDGMIFVY